MAKETAEKADFPTSSLFVGAGTALAFVVVARVAATFASTAPGSRSPLDALGIASGVAVSAALRFGAPGAGGVAAGCLTVALLFPAPHAGASLVALRALAEALAMLSLYRGLALRLSFARGDAVVRFVVAAIGASLLGSLVATAAGHVARVAPADDLTTKFGWTALADAVGILFIAPLALQPAVDLLRGLRKRAALAALGLVALLSVVLFHGVSSEAARMALAGVMFPLLLLVAVRGGPAATSVGLGMLGLAGLVAILLRRGPFAPTAHESALVFRVYELIAALTALVVAGTMAERRQADETLELHVFAANRTPDAMFMVTRQGRVFWANEAARESVGFTEEELANLSIAAVDESLAGPAFDALWQRLVEARHLIRESRHLTRSGQHVPVEVALAYLDRARPLAFFHVRDVTSRFAEDERRKVLEAQLRHAQKMEAIGTLAGGIAHDFNNVLAAILGNVEYSLQDEALPDDVREALEDVQTAGGRARALVGRLSTMSRREEPRLELVDVSAVLQEVARLLRATLPATISLDLQLPKGPVPLPADGAQLHQALVNLGTNAAHAMKDGGTLTMEVAAVSLTAGEAKRRHLSLRPDDYIRVRVTDTGHGMSAETKERIFEPFYTTKPVGEGTGLGLAVVHGIVEGHNGAIVVDSTLGRGTTFELYFPATSAKFTPPPMAKAGPAQPLALRVLLVDDDALVLAAARRTLTRAGCRVTAVAAPEEALALVQARPDDYDLLVTDVTMPGMSGPQLARAVHEVRPALRIVAITGYPGAGVSEALAAAGVHEILPKPFSDTALVAALARQADRPNR